MVGRVNYIISRFSHMFAAFPFRYILHYNLCKLKKKKSAQVKEQELTSTRSSLELTPEVTF